MRFINVTIEIPKYSFTKYEWSKEYNKIFVDRTLELPYPQNYGFVNSTLWDDGDALDCFVIHRESLFPTTQCRVVPIAIIDMMDNGASDSKLVCVFEKDVKYNWNARIMEIVSFLKRYKKNVKIKSVSLLEKDINSSLQRANDLWKIETMKKTKNPRLF